MIFSTIFAAIGGFKGLLGFGTSIAKAIADAKVAALQAGTEQERIYAEERVKALEAKAKVHGRLEACVRFAFAFPFIAYIWKTVLYDKVLSLGTTPHGLSATLEYVLFVIVGFYFLHWTIGKFR